MFKTSRTRTTEPFPERRSFCAVGEIEMKEGMELIRRHWYGDLQAIKTYFVSSEGGGAGVASARGAGGRSGDNSARSCGGVRRRGGRFGVVQPRVNEKKKRERENCR